MNNVINRPKGREAHSKTAQLEVFGFHHYQNKILSNFLAVVSVLLVFQPPQDCLSHCSCAEHAWHIYVHQEGPLTH